MSLMDDGSIDEERLFALFDRRHPDGRHLYSAEEIKDIIPLALLALDKGPGTGETPPELIAVMNEFAVKARIEPAMSPEEVQACFHRYYADHPANPRLLKELRGLLRGQVKAPKVDFKAKNVGRAFTQFQDAVHVSSTPIRQKSLWDETPEPEPEKKP